jgi:hypothetical protein
VSEPTHIRDILQEYMRDIGARCQRGVKESTGNMNQEPTLFDTEKQSRENRIIAAAGVYVSAKSHRKPKSRARSQQDFKRYGRKLASVAAKGRKAVHTGSNVENLGV